MNKEGRFNSPPYLFYKTMIGITTGQNKDLSEIVNINLSTNQNIHEDLIGTHIHVLWGGSKKLIYGMGLIYF